ncbi:hypothetical protein [Roseateles sp.]|uniref:hypothetical protein n=1 Tax=Roseateles sp. TaxID=1971397 RepID=UPI0031E46BFB
MTPCPPRHPTHWRSLPTPSCSGNPQGKRLSSAPNFYDERELDYRIQSADGRYAIRFQTGEGKVSAILAGDAKAVAYVEGCL